MKTKIVTGYIPIQGHVRSAKEYGELGEELFGKLHGDFDIHPFYETIDQTWLCKLIRKSGVDVTHSEADNPEKNTLAYHCAINQKFMWLLRAAMLDPLPSTFVWIDYGIGHVEGVTPEIVNEFMRKIEQDDFAMPGCLPLEGLMVNDLWPCWRFCGGVMVVPRDKVFPLFNEISKYVSQQLFKTHNVTWDMNNVAAVEKDLPGLRWYKADHDETMFTAYGDDLCVRH